MVKFISKKSIVRNVRPETVLPSHIVILCCTNESDGNYAQIRPNVHPNLLERQKSV